MSLPDYLLDPEPPDDERPACEECGHVHRKRCPMIFAKPRRIVAYQADDGAILQANSVAGERFIDSFIEAQNDYREKKERICNSLIAKGVAAAHPDDGWVDREQNTVHLCYPFFNCGVTVGSLIGLVDWRDNVRLVRVVLVESWGSLDRYHFVVEEEER